MRLIDIDDVMIAKRNPDVFIVHETAYGWNECLEIFRNAPTVDAVPVVHGKWKRVDPRSTVVTFRCSECNYYAHMNATNFCPNCGADMRQSEEPESPTYIPPEERSGVDDG